MLLVHLLLLLLLVVLVVLVLVLVLVVLIAPPASAPGDFRLAPHGAVPPILHSVIGSPWNHFGDLGPLIAKFLLHVDYDPVLLFCPVTFLDVRVEVVMPSLSALRVLFCFFFVFINISDVT